MSNKKYHISVSCVDVDISQTRTPSTPENTLWDLWLLHYNPHIQIIISDSLAHIACSVLSDKPPYKWITPTQDDLSWLQCHPHIYELEELHLNFTLEIMNHLLDLKRDNPMLEMGNLGDVFSRGN